MADPPGHSHQPLDSAVHHRLLASTIERGHPESVAELAQALGSSGALVRESLARLERNHGVVTDPGTGAPWLIHPFATTPTLFHVANADRGWWAPCIWCALGVAVLVPGPARITTVLGAETEPCVIVYDAGAVTPAGLVAHFPIPVAKAWNNVHRYCAGNLVFADRGSVEDWCERHGIARGAVLPVEKVAELARVWYGGHLAPDWRKPTASEARAKLESVGLTSAHWRVPDGDGRF